MGKNIKVRGEKISNVVGNGMCTDFPEDAIWGRQLDTIFWAGVKAGRMTKDDKEIEIEDDEYESELY
jgi:hypothetical protein